MKNNFIGQPTYHMSVGPNRLTAYHRAVGPNCRTIRRLELNATQASGNAIVGI